MAGTAVGEMSDSREKNQQERDEDARSGRWSAVQDTLVQKHDGVMMV